MIEKILKYLKTFIFILKPILITLPIGLIGNLFFNTNLLFFIGILLQISWILIILGSYDFGYSSFNCK